MDTERISIERQATRVTITAYRAGAVEEREDRLSGEEPLAIRAAAPASNPLTSPSRCAPRVTSRSSPRASSARRG